MSGVQDMQQYDPDRPCPKCGTRHNTTKYMSEYRPPPPETEEQKARRTEGSYYHLSPIDERAWMHPHCEHQRRTCQHCGYVWAESCVSMGTGWVTPDTTGPRALR